MSAKGENPEPNDFHFKRASCKPIDAVLDDQKPVLNENGQTEENIISFDGPEDQLNPLNWSPRRKWWVIGLLSCMNLTITLATLICIPAVPLILSSFRSDNESYSKILVSIWELGEACGPLLVAPLSEIFGRAPVYHTANILFVIFSIGCALSTSPQMLVALRCLTGVTVASVTLDPSVVGDIFHTDQRGKAMAIANLAPLIGPLAGPVIGGYISQAIGWRWTFWLPAILGAVIEAGFIAGFRETYKVRILHLKARRLRKQLANKSLESIYGDPQPAKILIEALVRPARMLVLSAVLFSIAVYVALVFGYLYLLLTSITKAFKDTYGFSTGSSSLTFLGLGTGMIIGTFFYQEIPKRFAKRLDADGSKEPEQRLPPMIMGGLVIPIGLFLYGWTIHFKVQWMAPIVGLALLGFGIIVTIIPAFNYLVDAFGIHAASAVAASITLRCVTGALLPLAGIPLYNTLGQGWGNTVLAFIAIVLLPVPILMMKYGETLRTRARLQVIL